MTEELIGKQVGEYEILKVLGSGRLTTVYRAYQPSLDRMVAVKVFPRKFADHAAFREGFEREVRIFARLEHFHLLPIYDVGYSDDLPYLVMRNLGSGSLKDKLDELGNLEPEEVVPTAQQIAAALGHLHQRDILHLDVKPQNILFDEVGDAYLSDISLNSVRKVIRETMGESYIGTPSYRPPELFSAETTPTAAADIYSLGITLYQMLTGVLPFQGDTPEELADAHSTAIMPAVQRYQPALTQEVEIVLFKALAKTPADRFSSVSALSTEITRAVGLTTDSTRRFPRKNDPDATGILKAKGDPDLEEARRQHDTRSKDDTEPVSGPPTPVLPSVKDVWEDSPAPEGETRKFDLKEEEDFQEQREAAAKRQKAARMEREQRAAPVVTTRSPWYTIALVLLLLVIAWFTVGSMIGFRVRGELNQLTLDAAYHVQTQQAATATQIGGVTATAEEIVISTGTAQAVAAANATGTATAALPTTTPSPTFTPSPTETPSPTPTVVGGGSQRIAYVSDQDGDPEIFTLDLVSGETVQLTKNDHEDRWPQWSPDGQWIAYSSLTEYGWHIFVVNSSGEEDPIELSPRQAFRSDKNPLWSANGRKIIFTSLEGIRLYIRTTNLDSAEQNVAQVQGGIERILDWSDDERTLLAFARLPDERLEILTIDLTTLTRTPLTTQAGIIEFAEFSPDGKQVVYTWLGTRWQMFLVEMTGDCDIINQCEWTRLTDDITDYKTPRFSPDGSLIMAVANPDNNWDIFIYDLTGDRVQRVTNKPADEYDAVWEPIHD